MLCNRPMDGDGVPLANRSKALDTNNGSFICGIVKKPWGKNVVISEKSRVLCRLSRKDNALSKHKKWLSELQKERERQELEEREDKDAKEQRVRQFREREARKRERALDVGESCSGVVAGEEDTAVCPQQIIQPLEGQEQRQAKRHHNGNLPAWAMTESEAETVKATSAQQEQEDLLNFVQGLDIDKFESDLELRLLMNQVKERIKTLEREKQKDEARLRVIEDCENAAEQSMEFNQVDVFDTSVSSDWEDCEEDESDVRSIAETAISSHNGLMGYIHSRKSVEALVSKSKERLGNGPLDSIAEELVVEQTVSPPVMVTHKDDEGARLVEMKSLNKLPFKNRNPAV